MTEQYEDAPSWWEFPMGMALLMRWPVVGVVALFVALKVLT